MTNAPSFGGQWTDDKLRILRGYLTAYSRVMKKEGFWITYFDGFAGAGAYTHSSGDYEEYGELQEGSARIALGIDDRPFDQLIFVEQNKKQLEDLQALAVEFPERKVDVVHGDANEEVQRFCRQMGRFDRAVVFLDPYATEVSWSTVAAIAATGKIDCWILFPLMAVTRMMPTDEEPGDSLKAHLDRIFGGRVHWQETYQDSPQLPLFDIERQRQRLSGSKHIVEAYRKRLESVYHAVAPTRRTLKNSRNVELFELFFAVGNPRGTKIAIDIADHLLRNW